nr:bacteriophage abortive infection AbiH family protein [uncultured Brevundimonas sp.]
MQSQASLFDDAPINHSRCLYIVGNGFDLHHRIPSSYSHFGAYVRATDARLADIAEDFLPAPVGETLWSRLEENLAWLDTDQIVDQASIFLNSPGADDWSDADNHAYQYEVEQIATALSSRLKASFHAWLRTLPIPSVGSWTGPRLRLYTTARYLSFNYTSTLTRLYDVPEDRNPPYPRAHDRSRRRRNLRACARARTSPPIRS